MRCNNTYQTASGEVTTPCIRKNGHKGDCKGTILGTPCRWDGRFSSEEELYMHNKRIDNFSINLLQERLEFFETQIIMADTLPHMKEDLGLEYNVYHSLVDGLKRAIEKLKV